MTPPRQDQGAQVPSKARLPARAVADPEPAPTIDPAPRSLATPEQAAGLRELIVVILADDTEAERDEALAIALADPDAALTSFRALATDKRNGTRETLCPQYTTTMEMANAAATGEKSRSLEVSEGKVSATTPVKQPHWRGRRPAGWGPR